MHSRHPLRPLRVNDEPTIRDYQPGDEQAILAASERAFAEVDPAHVPRSLERWRWQYLENPSGARIKLAVASGGRVLAQYAGQSRHVRVGEQRLRVSHCADSLVLREERGLSKLGLFVRTGEAFARDFGGAGADDDRWMWGFPVAAAQRIGERALGYVTVRGQVALWLEDAAEALREASHEEGARTVSSVGPEHDAFFLQRARQYGAVGERDAAYLRWRYLEHPDHDYTLIEARDAGGALTGIAVGRRAPFEGREAWVLCDWLARESARVRLVAAALREARGLPIVLVVPPWCAEFTALQELGFRVRPSSLLLVGRSYDRRHDHRFWSTSWYYTLGDSDLV